MSERLKMMRSRKLISIALALLTAFAVLALIQWAIGTRGWDLTAGLLTIVMVALGFLLAGTLLGIMRRRPPRSEEKTELREVEQFLDKMSEESLDNDPYVVGSKSYRIFRD